MSRTMIIGTAAVVLGAIVLAGAAHSLTVGTSTTKASAVTPPAAQIDVFELMGRALGNMPVENASML